MRVLARELDCEILEWRNAMGESSSNVFGGTALAESYFHLLAFIQMESLDDPQSSTNHDNENLFSKFEAFLTRASTCQSIFADAEAPERNTQHSSSQSESSSSTRTRKRQILLLEDLPNILHANTQSRFHAALQSLVASPTASPVPIVIIVSDAGIRGEASDERLATGSWGKDRDGVLDIRTVLSKDLLHGPYVTQIGLVQTAFHPDYPSDHRLL